MGGMNWPVIPAPATETVPTVPSPHAEPIRVTKLCRIRWNGTRAAFTGAGVNICYEAVDVAQCGAGLSHPVPDPAGCRCGFHAMKVADRHRQSWVMTAELYGRVIEHRDGWRAQKQRVIDVTPPTMCLSGCGTPLRGYAVYGGHVCGWCVNCLPRVVMPGYRLGFGAIQAAVVTLEEIQQSLAPVELVKPERS